MKYIKLFEEISDNEISQELKDYLTKWIYDNCDPKTKCYEVYWDYDEYVSPKTIWEAVEKAINEDTDFNIAIGELDWAIDSYMQTYSTIYDQIVDACPNDLIHELESLKDVWQHLDDCGFVDVDLFSNAKYEDVYAGLIISDNYHIADCYSRQGNSPGDINYDNPTWHDNGLRLYVESQGYTEIDLFHYAGGLNSDDQTLNAVFNEIEDDNHDLQLMAFVTFDKPQDIVDLIKMINSKNNATITFPKGTIFGLADLDFGYMSNLNIKSEKEFTVPVSKLIVQKDVEQTLEKKDYSIYKINKTT